VAKVGLLMFLLPLSEGAAGRSVTDTFAAFSFSAHRECRRMLLDMRACMLFVLAYSRRALSCHDESHCSTASRVRECWGVHEI
jgi:hypothetical protein